MPLLSTLTATKATLLGLGLGLAIGGALAVATHAAIAIEDRS